MERASQTRRNTKSKRVWRRIMFDWRSTASNRELFLFLFDTLMKIFEKIFHWKIDWDVPLSNSVLVNIRKIRFDLRLTIDQNVEKPSECFFKNKIWRSNNWRIRELDQKKKERNLQVTDGSWRWSATSFSIIKDCCEKKRRFCFEWDFLSLSFFFFFLFLCVQEELLTLRCEKKRKKLRERDRWTQIMRLVFPVNGCLAYLNKREDTRSVILLTIRLMNFTVVFLLLCVFTVRQVNLSRFLFIESRKTQQQFFLFFMRVLE